MTKSEQLLLIKALKSGFKITRESQNIIKDSVDFYKAISKLSKIDLIKSFSKSSCRREKEYVLTDLGIVIASNISQEENPKIYYALWVGI